jgi:hypothetical protein
MFNTQSGDEVIQGLTKETRKAMAKKTFPERFDHLFALTHCLNLESFWLHDNDIPDELQAGLDKLAAAWSTVLAKDDATLEIDPEFTRPGILALLESFGKHVSKNTQGNHKFSLSLFSS